MRVVGNFIGLIFLTRQAIVLSALFQKRNQLTGKAKLVLETHAYSHFVEKASQVKIMKYWECFRVINGHYHLYNRSGGAWITWVWFMKKNRMLLAWVRRR